jgi:hypothetical protein
MTMLSRSTSSTVTASGRRRALPGAVSFRPTFESGPKRTLSKKIIGAQRRIF